MSALERASGPPIFVVGCPRSGTTMLRLMLDSHPDLAIPPESHFVTQFWSAHHRYEKNDRFEADRLARDVMGTFRFKEWRLPPEAVTERLRRLERPSFGSVMEAFFLAYADREGKTRWGDKTPGYSIEMAALAQIFRDARFVHLIRDGRDVAMSLDDLGRVKLRPAMAMWAQRVMQGRSDGRRLGPDRYLEVFYEALVDDPERELKAICDHADLEFRPGDMLRYHERAERAMASKAWGSHQGLARPPTKGMRDWRRSLDDRTQAVLEGIGGDALTEFGYERRFSDPPAVARREADRVVRGYRRAMRAWRLRRRAIMILKPRAVPPHRRF
ncbi:MAG TPA: sulfotransferase [Actinomycetota bacterium]|nr:sulfotransferase [Actinomycetota bacterium]